MLSQGSRYSRKEGEKKEGFKTGPLPERDSRDDETGDIQL